MRKGDRNEAQGTRRRERGARMCMKSREENSRTVFEYFAFSQVGVLLFMLSLFIEAV